MERHTRDVLGMSTRMAVGLFLSHPVGINGLDMNIVTDAEIDAMSRVCEGRPLLTDWDTLADFRARGLVEPDHPLRLSARGQRVTDQLAAALAAIPPGTPATITLPADPDAPLDVTLRPVAYRVGKTSGTRYHRRIADRRVAHCGVMLDVTARMPLDVIAEDDRCQSCFKKTSRASNDLAP